LVLKVKKIIISNFIKFMKHFLKQYFILILGVGIATYHLFSFSSRVDCGKYLNYAISESCYPTTLYYYSNQTIIFLTLGVVLIAIGLLKIRENKK